MYKVDSKISRKTLKKMSEKMFDELVKAVVDVKIGLLVVDAQMHSDMEEWMLENGSQQKDLWGINLYPDVMGEGFVEFDSLVNLRPSWGNKSSGVDDVETRKMIIKIVKKSIEDETS